ncbi:ABC transporter permease [Hespellia stercorisuis]|uniref:Putative ABC transport system permease protein n=1 Tax=Hespellia stercorisuis DSM 15480 TaxID=1121950 RepID=A0A1M6MXJ1_9FIRM|nr:ABC transporter permease [Hespellia stercorisuis]SHJ88132.1 putative ABC transport system permease protein [Hespellia stercorisuis DSM 15480]
MSKFFYARLAADNIKKNGKIYFPYLLTCIFTTALFYIMKSLSLNEGIKDVIGDETVRYIMGMGCWVVAIFSGIFLFYTNSFLMKQRKKEFGLFNILGMEKKHLAKVILLETIYLYLISMAAGLVFGVALDKLMYLLIMKVLGYDIALGFYISGQAIRTSILLFGVIFLLILLNSIRQIQLSKPIELLQSRQAGEREPKSKWLMTILGLGCLAAGYYISVTTENPLAALPLFFVAVILVIIGTYLLFTAGSITLLKLLRKNKKYYYQTKHFTSVSGMIYRMKQNAVGLANICVLSTMVLVMVSSTTSLMVGLKDVITTRYPYDISLYAEGELPDKCKNIDKEMKKAAAEHNVDVTDEITYTYLTFSGVENGNEIITDRENNSNSAVKLNNLRNLFFIPLSDYNRVMGSHERLGDGEILIYSNRDAFAQQTLEVFGEEYKIKKRLDDFVGNGLMASNVVSSHFIVVNDIGELEKLQIEQKAAYGESASEIRSLCGFNVSGDQKDQIAVYKKMTSEFDFAASAECRAESERMLTGVYGGLFFIGIFLGMLFVAATILIIYYKQISEGYDDKERFEIMQKVGMSQSEIRKTIHSQILTVFFLPLLTAGIHVAFAFPLIARLLAILSLINVPLFVGCTLACFLAFAVMYGIIYFLTARVYYRIVSWDGAAD